MSNNFYGLAMVICAPSGSGKSTLIKSLLEDYDNFTYSVSCTTRRPRLGEQDGREYFFISKKEFEDLVQQEYFAEWAEVHGQFYGTPLKGLLDNLKQGRDIVFDIDVQGARQLKAKLETSVTVFILPPSRAELKSRLNKRSSDTGEDIKNRLETAMQELKAANDFDYWVLNNDFDLASQALKSIYLAEKHRPARMMPFFKRLMDTW